MPEIKILPGLATFIQQLFSHDEALGLPKGTVRGLVFLVMTTAICYMAIKQLPIPAEIAAAWGGVVGLYFGGKSGNGNGHEPPKPA